MVARQHLMTSSKRKFHLESDDVWLLGTIVQAWIYISNQLTNDGDDDPSTHFTLLHSAPFANGCGKKEEDQMGQNRKGPHSHPSKPHHTQGEGWSTQIGMWYMSTYTLLPLDQATRLPLLWVLLWCWSHSSLNGLGHSAGLTGPCNADHTMDPSSLNGLGHSAGLTGPCCADHTMDSSPTSHLTPPTVSADLNESMHHNTSSHLPGKPVILTLH